MRVLVVAYYFPPIGGGGVHRTLQWVRHLVACGDEPWVVTVDDAAWARDPSGLARVPRSARVVRVPNPDWGRLAAWRDKRLLGTSGANGSENPGRLRRWLVPDLAVGWSAMAVPWVVGLARAGRVDAVYTTGPPYSAHLLGLAARRAGVPWVADFRDAWTDCPTRVDFGPRRQKIERALETAVLERASRVVFAGDAARERALARVPGLDGRSRCILTGFAPDDPAPLPPPSAPPLRLVHAGSIRVNQMERGFDAFLDALSAWRREDPGARFRVELLGAEPDLEGRVRARSLQSWVRVSPAVARRELGPRIARAHGCLAFSADAPFGGDPIPGKCFDAIAAGRPLLALTGPGGLRDWVRREGVGEVIDPADRGQIVATLQRWSEQAARGGIPVVGEEARQAFAAPRAMSRVRELVVDAVNERRSR